MHQPIYRDGFWWHQRQDGLWLRWDELAQRWIEAPPASPAIQVAAVPGLAQWWQRLVAFLLDSVLLLIPLTTVYLVAVAPGAAQCDPAGGSCSANDTGTLLFFMLCYVVVVPAYFVLSNGGRKGQTLGKKTVHIMVCDKDTGESIGYGRALGRWLMYGLFWLFGLLGVLNALWPLWDPLKQAWHDKAVNSVVVSTPR